MKKKVVRSRKATQMMDFTAVRNRTNKAAPPPKDPNEVYFNPHQLAERWGGCHVSS
jgi:hypothetical protein